MAKVSTKAVNPKMYYFYNANDTVRTVRTDTIYFTYFGAYQRAVSNINLAYCTPFTYTYTYTYAYINTCLYYR